MVSKLLLSSPTMMTVVLPLPLVDELSKSTHNSFFLSFWFASCYVDGFDLIGPRFEIPASTPTRWYPKTTSSYSG